MNDYSIALAIYDFLPSVFTGFALMFIAQMVGRSAPQSQGMAVIGGGLVVLAGVLKASWKLIMATTGQDIVLLSEAMFPLMGPGFLLVGLAVWSGLRSARGKSVPSYLDGIALAILVAVVGLALHSMFIAGNERGYFPVFLMLASLSNVGLSILLIREALRRQRRTMAFLFFLNIAMVFALQPIAAMPEQSIAIHWFEQTLTSAGAAAFMTAAFLLLREVSQTVPDIRREWARAGGD